MVYRTSLARVLEEQGRSQVWLTIQIAARIGRPVFPQEVSTWVRGRHLPEPGTRQAIADALGVPEAVLFAHDAPQEEAA